MKLNTTQAEFDTEGMNLDESREFTISNDPMAFKILSTSIYSDKIRALIRELLCNAYDACPSKTIDVHLPTSMESFFSVRDYGHSMDHETVMTLYTSFFKSTKRDTNKKIGGFGIGSKVPFAFTDQFTVTTWVGGRRRVYNMYLDDSGLPRVILLSDIKSSDPSGVEVKVPVDPKDIFEFVTKYYPTVWDFPTKAFSNSGFHNDEITEGKTFRKHTYSHPWLSDVYISYGNVSYKIAAEHFDSYYLDLLVNAEAHLGLIVPMGSLDIAASREDLHYSERTIKSVKKAIDKALDEIAETLVANSKDIDFCEKYVEKVLGHRRQVTYGIDLRVYQREIMDRTADAFSIYNPFIKGHVNFGIDCTLAQVLVESDVYPSRATPPTLKNMDPTRNNCLADFLTRKDRALVMVDDVHPTLNVARIAHAVFHELFSVFDGTEMKGAKRLLVLRGADIARLEYPKDRVVYASAYKDKVRKIVERNAKSKLPPAVDVCLFTKEQRRDISYNFTPKATKVYNLRDKETAFIVVKEGDLKGKKAKDILVRVMKGRYLPLLTFWKTIKYNFNVNNTAVYFIEEQYVGVIKRYADWVDLRKNAAVGLKNGNVTFDRIVSSKLFDEAGSYGKYKCLKLFKDMGSINFLEDEFQSTKLREIVETCKVLQKNKFESSKYHSLSEFLYCPYEVKVKVEDIAGGLIKLREGIEQSLPWLKFCDIWEEGYQYNVSYREFLKYLDQQLLLLEGENK